MSTPTADFTPSGINTAAAHPNQQEQKQQQPITITSASPTQQLQLCASCDRCRARKTKCDGNRPCGNCVTRYQKVNKCETVQGVDFGEFDCVYSPAKRRGPIPGRNSHPRSPNTAAANNNLQGGGASIPLNGAAFYGISNTTQAAAPTPNFSANNLNDGLFSLMNNSIMNTVAMAGNNGVNSNTYSPGELQQMLILQQQLLVQQQQQQQQQQQEMLQQQQQQGLLQQLAAASMAPNSGDNTSCLQAMNTALPATNNAMVGGVDGNYWANSSELTAGNMSNMSVNNNGTGGDGFNINSVNDLLNNVSNFQAQQQQSPAAGTTATVPNIEMDEIHRSAKRANREVGTTQPMPSPQNNYGSLPESVTAHFPLLQLNNPTGAILRSYYELSANDVLNLPPIPTEEEYCALLHVTPDNLPLYNRSARQAAQFSELAIGALANNQIPLALELSNASAMCLRNCVGTPPSHRGCLYDVARAYLLHGIFRSFRGDMERYFKYRRVCLTHILQMNDEPNVEALLAAMSFHDSWAYLMHNAAEDTLPDIDKSLPRINGSSNDDNNNASQLKAASDCSLNPSSIAMNPINQMWMQGQPSVFLNNEASLVSRSLDAFACAIRSCCDQANDQLDDMIEASGMEIPRNSSPSGMEIPGTSSSDHTSNVGQQFLPSGQSPTTTAVMANENELCSRNIVVSAKSLLDQHSGLTNGRIKKHGLYMVAAVMTAFLEDGKVEGSEGGSGSEGGGSVGGFTNSQIKNLLHACDVIIQHPLLLHSPGPVYHMASNACILLGHLLNGIHANCVNGNRSDSSAGGFSFSGSNNKVESILFDEVLDTFMATRKALINHRKSIPVKLRCHGIPRPSGVGPFDKKLVQNPEAPFIDLGETLMCLCRGCQNFVLMGCSPCVAAERSIKAAKDHASQRQREQEAHDNTFDRQLRENDDLSLDDDALLDVLYRIVQD